ncbi:PSD1 and planctomycete cytochrome C domain-containing protein [Rubripirellula reticaptiva]|uniref:Planctomycete cytochrome C n=1 Tax=Rubripirellula reticaptiva TaxID=2528013 RepID=A0A5C6EJV1_9BACT|nr:PSD1 and planctomycete cytochrome C domain-containing protein [Rubripirellula reticaptiva]TWU47896.1 Planctomycete cytochrome C [Rubripirellula reticaptiva]
MAGLLIRSISFIAMTIVGCCYAVANETVEFTSDVQPILDQHCSHCHGSEEQNSGLRLDRRSSMLRGGDVGVATVVPGNPDDSFLIAVVTGTNDLEMQMPPDGERLSAAEIETLKKWVTDGAPWPGQMDATADDIDSNLWSLEPIKTFRSETVSGASTDGGGFESVIDQMIAKRLGESDLSLSPCADPTTQLRRLSLVITGLPPTPDQVALFLDDPDGVEAGYEKAVTRLLDSPAYGERWAQHWLDVIRWAETVGFETNSPRPNAWPYRDWVIDSLNHDKPYDQFVFEQIAGDTVGEDAALGFLVSGPANLPGQIGRDDEAMRQARQDELDEVIQTVSQSVLGLTVGCARCHNHKFDPILQRDYYSMQAIFAGLSFGERRLRGKTNDEFAAKVPAARDRLEKLTDESDQLRISLSLETPLDSLHTETIDPVTTSSVRMEIAATGNNGPASLYEFEVWSGETNAALATAGATASASSFELANQTRHHDNLIDGLTDRRQAFPWVASRKGPAWIQIDFPEPTTIDRVVWDRGSSQPADYVLKVLDGGSGDWLVVADTGNRYLREDDTRPAKDVTLSGKTPEQVELIVKANANLRSARANLKRLTAGPKVFAASFSDSPEPTWLLHRGDPMNRREQVVPAIPRILGDLQLKADEPEVNRRVSLARDLTRQDHPLTSRVIVNRVWQHHFGEGLVDTSSDFGEMGSRPSHPELLDALASNFVHGGWSLKSLHRQIVMSDTFRQSNRPYAAGTTVDADSRLLWRYPPRRLEAESIRDSILQASGKLNRQPGGPGFNLFKQRGGLADYQPIETFDESGWRRMIYAHKIRMQSVDVFGAFDCPDAGQMQPKRTRSITPTQSLGLLNSPFVLQQAKFFADRVRAEAGDSVSDQVSCALAIAYSRPPDVAETKRLVQFVETESLAELCRVLINSSEFLYIP